MATRRLSAAEAAAAAAVTAAVALLGSGCGASAPPGAGEPPIPAALLRESRPIGHGPRFAPPARGPLPGPCRAGLGARAGVHLEVFAAGRVVLIAAGIGARPPLRHDAGRIAGARCFGRLVTLDPTGTVLIRSGARLTVGDVFRAWGQPLTRRRIASFTGPVRVYEDGRRRALAPGAVALTPHAEIVLEVGPYVPPHRSYVFPGGE